VSVRAGLARFPRCVYGRELARFPRRVYGRDLAPYRASATRRSTMSEALTPSASALKFVTMR
jgi:hypothetical protein